MLRFSADAKSHRRRTASRTTMLPIALTLCLSAGCKPSEPDIRGTWVTLAPLYTWEVTFGENNEFKEKTSFSPYDLRIDGHGHYSLSGNKLTVVLDRDTQTNSRGKMELISKPETTIYSVLERADGIRLVSADGDAHTFHKE